MRFLLAFVILMHAFATIAQGPDGKWLRQGLDAYERVNVTKKPQKGDAEDSVAILAFIGGVIAVNRTNNFAATLMSEKDARIVRTFTPLRGTPKNITIETIVSLTNKFMIENPDLLDQGADGIITLALQRAYPK